MPDVSSPMMIIRKRLATSEVSSPDFRTEDGVVQQTGDGGITWVDSPANDVRHADAWRLPPVVADDPKCQAAANMTRFLVNWFEELLPILSAAGSAWALLSTLILLFVVLGPFALVIIMLDVAATLLGIGATAIGSAFTTEVFDQLTCIFFDNIGGDGQVSAEQLESINDDVDAQIGGVAATVLHIIFALVGEVGVSNWGARGDAPADCDNCACSVAVIYPWDNVYSSTNGYNDCAINPPNCVWRGDYIGFVVPIGYTTEWDIVVDLGEVKNVTNVEFAGASTGVANVFAIMEDDGTGVLGSVNPPAGYETGADVILDTPHSTQFLWLRGQGTSESASEVHVWLMQATIYFEC